MCIFKKKNNKCFIVGDTTKELWRHKMHNMETRVESPWFFDCYGDDRMLDSRFKAVSPRTVVATVGDVEYKHLEKAMMGCATVYVPYPYPGNGLPCRQGEPYGRHPGKQVPWTDLRVQQAAGRD